MATVTDESLQHAQHEAAHVVVGVALGLRLWLATIDTSRLPPHVKRWENKTAAITLWHPAPFPREADLLMTAAGVAWERRVGDLTHASGDLQILRGLGVRGNRRIKVLETAAWAILTERAGIHARVTRAILEGPLTERAVRRLIRGVE